MARRQFDGIRKFETARRLSSLTGYSEKRIRQGLKEGRFPYLQRGNRKYLNTDAFFRILNDESFQNARVD